MYGCMGVWAGGPMDGIKVPPARAGPAAAPEKAAMQTRKRGFTLIELLVVIALIAIIAAIVFPAFAQAREMARASTCLSNEKQIGVAALLYAEDYEGAIVPIALPTGLPRDTARRDIVSWPHLLQPYLKSGEPPRTENPQGIEPLGVMKCPSYNEAEIGKAMDQPDCWGPGTGDWFFPARQTYAHYGLGPGYWWGSCTREDPYTHYAGNWFQDLADGTSALMTLAGVRRPSETAILTDGFVGILHGQRDDGTGFIGTTFGCESQYTHHGGGNVCFLDGHVGLIHGDVERYLLQDSADGCWYKRYFAADR